MSNQVNQSSEVSNTIEVLTRKIADLTNVLRITTNTIALISSADCKGGDSPAIAELLNYHQGFANNVRVQMEALQASLPKPTIAEQPKVIEAEVVA